MLSDGEPNAGSSTSRMEAESTLPLLSIVTVTRNCEATLERTLASVRRIKTPAMQYIVIDGASTDSTLAIISKYDDIIDILISERDDGIYNAMNKGAELASGEYTLFLNGDDYLLPDGFNKALLLLLKDRPDILSCRSEAVSESGEPLGLLEVSLWRMFFFNTVPHLSTFVRSDLQKRCTFREQFKISADYDLFLRLLLQRRHFQKAEMTTATHYRGGFSNNLSLATSENRKIRRDNLGVFVYVLTRALEILNQFVNFSLRIFRRLSKRSAF